MLPSVRIAINVSFNVTLFNRNRSKRRDIIRGWHRIFLREPSMTCCEDYVPTGFQDSLFTLKETVTLGEWRNCHLSLFFKQSPSARGDGIVFFFSLSSSFFPRGSDFMFLAFMFLAFFESRPFLVVLPYRDQYLGVRELSRPASGLSFFPSLSFAHSLPPLGEWCREVVRSRQWDREIMVKENRNKSARMRLGRIAEEWVSCLWQMVGYKGTLKLTQCR